MADWKDILSENDEPLTSGELLKYFDGNLSEEEKYLIEKKINNSEFNADALQGLSEVENKENLHQRLKQLNQKLHQLTAKKPRRIKRKINIFEWVVLVILFLLFICVICYVIINLHQGNKVIYLKPIVGSVTKVLQQSTLLPFAK